MIKHQIEAPSLLDNGVWKRAHTEVMAMLAKGKENGGLDATKPYRIYITDGKLSRSPNQNRYYWGVVVKTFSDASGMEPEDVHDVWKRAYAGHRYEKWAGGRRRVYNSTTAMKTADFAKYLDKVIQFCAENGVVIPHPERIPDEQLVELHSEGLLK
jgi:hypothetical protein